ELAPRFRDPSTPTRASVADAVTKEIPVGIVDASNPLELEIALERPADDRVTMNRILAGRGREEPAEVAMSIAVNLAGVDANRSADKRVEVGPGDGDEVGPS